MLRKSDYLKVDEAGTSEPKTSHVTFYEVIERENHSVKGIDEPVVIGESHGSIEDSQKNKMVYALNKEYVNFQWDGELSHWVVNLSGLLFLREYAASLDNPVDIIIAKDVRDRYLQANSDIIEDDVVKEIDDGEFVNPYEQDDRPDDSEVQEKEI